jgi:DNA replication protein DnaC
MWLPEKYWSVKFASILPEGSEHKRIIGRYLHLICTLVDSGKGLLLYGDNSQGKTSASAVILKEARRWGYTGLFVRSNEVVDASMSNVKFDTSFSLKERAKHVDLLIMDDLGKEYRADSGWSVRLIDNLIRHRVQNRLSTIVTSNMQLEAIEEVYKPSMVKAMIGALYPVMVSGHDYRVIEDDGLCEMLLQ